MQALMGTYQKNGHLHGKFSPQRQKTMEAVGRELGRKYFEFRGGVVADNDVTPDGKLDYTKADLKVCWANGSELLVETATKGNDIWSYIYGGIDIETRKAKYLSQSGASNLVVFMAKQDGSEAILIPGTCLLAAKEACGDEYLGLRSVKSTPGFEMPDHECYRVRKNCKGPGGWTEEDFYRVAYRYATHLRITDSGYKIIKRWEPFNGKSGNTSE